MAPSLVGFLICCAIFLAALRSQAPIVVALIASFAFGSTAIVSLPSLGGSSPMIYVVFAVGLIVSVALRRDINRDLTAVFSQQRAAWLLLVLGMYAMVGAYLLPRIFAGETTAFIPEHSGGGIVEVQLGPAGGNITQTLYMLLGIMVAIALGILMREGRMFRAVRQGYFAWAILHVSMGFADFFGKIVGLSDVLAPIRTASYAMLTDAGVAGFSRIAGAYSEASGFGAATVMLLAFTYTYWRRTNDRLALALSGALVVLLMLSTSTTAYVAGGVLLLCALASVGLSLLRGRMRKQDVLLLSAGLAALVAIVGIAVFNERALDPVWHLFDTIVVNKASSASGAERAYWNYRSLQSLYDTAGLGIGLGSSRASSWIIAVVSQLGIAGTLMIGVLVLALVRSGDLPGAGALDPETRDVALSVRASCFAGLLTASISGASADPGIQFFVAVAVVLSYRRMVLGHSKAQGRWRAPTHALGAQSAT